MSGEGNPEVHSCPGVTGRRGRSWSPGGLRWLLECFGNCSERALGIGRPIRGLAERLYLHRTSRVPGGASAWFSRLPQQVETSVFPALLARRSAPLLGRGPALPPWPETDCEFARPSLGSQTSFSVVWSELKGDAFCVQCPSWVREQACQDVVFTGLISAGYLSASLVFLLAAWRSSGGTWASYCYLQSWRGCWEVVHDPFTWGQLPLGRKESRFQLAESQTDATSSCLSEHLAGPRVGLLGTGRQSSGCRPLAGAPCSLQQGAVLSGRFAVAGLC